MVFLSFTINSFAVCVLTAKCTGGNWSAAGTWTVAGCPPGTTIPADNMKIIIPACATVTVDINSPNYNTMEIHVYGTLDFDNGQKINMCPGYVYVYPGGQLTGGTPGSKINICGTSVWNGGTTTTGPISYGTPTTLPIELISFTAMINNQNKVDIKWATATETNNDYYTIEKTKDGVNYEFVAQVDGAGNSTSVINYSSIDHSPFSGISYYRLKQTDYNGVFTYSNLVAVEYNGNTNFDFNVYPNPSTGETFNMSISNSFNEEVLVVVRDITGKENYSKVVITKEDNETVFAFDMENKLPAGIYVITATSKQNIYSKKLIVK